MDKETVTREQGCTKADKEQEIDGIPNELPMPRTPLPQDVLEVDQDRL